MTGKYKEDNITIKLKSKAYKKTKRKKGELKKWEISDILLDKNE